MTMGQAPTITHRVRPRLTESFKCLSFIADPVRLHIYTLVDRGEATVAQLTASMDGASTQTVRRHLDALVTSGVIQRQASHGRGTAGRPADRYSLTRAAHAKGIRVLRALECL